MLRIQVPATRASERRYILRVILAEFLGLEYRVEESEAARVTRIEHEAESKAIIVADELLGTDDSRWLKPESLPTLPVKSFSPRPDFGFGPNYCAPVMYPGKGLQAAESESAIDFDLFGSVFFLLTRYEEVVLDVRDRFGRFQAKESVMFKAGALDRPLADEYVEILRRAIELVWPGTKFKRHGFRIVPTHDVDAPYDYLFMPAWRAARRSVARLAQQRSFTGATDALQRWRRVRSGDDLADPGFEALLRMMELNEKAGLPGIFYFICGHTAPEIDGDYEIGHPRIRRLLRTIHARGHFIGLHPSYGSLGKVDVLKGEFARLRRVCEEEGIQQNEWSVRSHYLRWESRHSFRDFDAVGFDFDSTLTFAEHAGFRCGTCREYSTFDLLTGRELRLKERPLIAMECSVIRPYYQGLKFAEAAEFFGRLKERCRGANGDYIFLWHNSTFPSANEWELYRQQVQTA